MGLMNNIRKAQEMAQQAAQTGGAGQMSPSAGDVEYANLAMKLNQNGVPGVATINSITESGAGSDPVNKAYDIDHEDAEDISLFEIVSYPPRR